MGGPWNDTTDRQLLLTIIHLTAPQLPNWDEVAKLMGEGFTAAAVRQHFQKIRKECGTKSGDQGGTPGAKSTPRKSVPKNTNGETPSKSTGKRKGRKPDGHDDDDESPSKKANIKTEEDAHGLDLI